MRESGAKGTMEAEKIKVLEMRDIEAREIGERDYRGREEKGERYE